MIVVAKSDNKKLGNSAATYLPLSTCPQSCPLLDRGCYAQTGRLSIQLIGKAEVPVEDAHRMEVRGIDALKGARPLRLHVSGDCTTSAQAEHLAEAAERYVARTGNPVWTYTHAWRGISRQAWGCISVLASCETVREVREAQARGYPAALVVEAFPGAARYEVDGRPVVPCPEQTRGITCAECRLCMQGDRLLRSGVTVGFAAHGLRKGVVKQVLAGKRAAEVGGACPTATD